MSFEEWPLCSCLASFYSNKCLCLQIGAHIYIFANHIQIPDSGSQIVLIYTLFYYILKFYALHMSI